MRCNQELVLGPRLQERLIRERLRSATAQKIAPREDYEAEMGRYEDEVFWSLESSSANRESFAMITAR